MKVVKNVFLIGLPIVIALSTFFSTVTSSRFGNSTDNSQAELFANLRYAGEPQVNFMGLMYDQTTGLSLGYRSFPLFRKLVGLEYFGHAGTDKDENLLFLDKIHKHPNFILYTAAGDWYFDFGPYFPIALLFVLNYFMYINRGKFGDFNFFNFVLAIILGYYAINGVFYAQFQNEAGNFLLLFMILFYYKNRNHKYSIVWRDRIRNGVRRRIGLNPFSTKREQTNI